MRLLRVIALMGDRLLRTGCRKMRSTAAIVVMLALTGMVCTLPATGTWAQTAVRATKKKAAPATTTVKVINGASVSTQVFPATAASARNASGKSAADSVSVRVLNGTVWSTETFKAQPTVRGKKSANPASGMTQIRIMNGTRTETTVFKGGVPPARTGMAASKKSGQPVVVGIASGDAKDASAGGRKVVIGIESADSVATRTSAAHPKRRPYQPAQMR